jgi:hypothetical protein
MIVSGCYSSGFPFANRNCGTKDTRFCNPELSKEMSDYDDSLEQIALAVFNYNVRVGEDEERRHLDIETLLKSLL